MLEYLTSAFKPAEEPQDTTTTKHHGNRVLLFLKLYASNLFFFFFVPVYVNVYDMVSETRLLMPNPTPPLTPSFFFNRSNPITLLNLDIMHSVSVIQKLQRQHLHII